MQLKKKVIQFHPASAKGTSVPKAKEYIAVPGDRANRFRTEATAVRLRCGALSLLAG